MMKNRQIFSLPDPTQRNRNDYDVGNRFENSLTRYRSVSVENEGSKHVEHKRLQSRTGNPEKQSQSCTEEIAAERMEHPEVVGEGCHPGFWKDSIMMNPYPRPSEGITGPACFPQIGFHLGEER
jgi:hypothetical protein